MESPQRVVLVNEDDTRKLDILADSDVKTTPIGVVMMGKGSTSFINSVKIDDTGRLHTRSFRNAAGDGRRMLVDADRHGQVDVLESALPTGAAKESKQDDIITGLDDITVSKIKGVVSTNNSSNAPLGIDEVFTGTADDISDYAAVNIALKTNKDSATDGLSLEWSQDGTNWDEKLPVSIHADEVFSYEFGVRARYFRVIYTNGATAQGTFRLQVMYHPHRTRMGARAIETNIDHEEFAPTRRAILAAKKPNGTYENIHSTAGANLKVSIEEIEAGLGDYLGLATSDKQNAIEAILANIRTGTNKIIAAPATEAKQLADNHTVTVSNPTTDPETGLATSAKQDTLIAKDFATQTTLALVKAKTDNLDTALSGIKTGTDKIIASPATEAKQLADGHNVNLEGLDAPVTTALTLTTANTQYLCPSSELANRKLLVIYNVSDTDVYIGSSSVTTTNGIPLEAGGIMNIDAEKDLYAVCGTDSKIINLLELS